MRLPLAFCLALLSTRLTAATPAPTVWPLDQPATVGGLKAEVLGAPRVESGPDGTALFFNGTTDGLFVPVNPLQDLARFTVEALIRPAPDGAPEQRFLHIQDNAGSRALMEIRLTAAGWALDTFLFSEKNQQKLPLLDRTRLHPVDRWTWVALVYADGHMAHYINGVKELEGDVTIPPMGAGKISLGVRQNKVYWFKGGIREVRFSPAALAPSALQRVER
jgi:hypothetical protein